MINILDIVKGHYFSLTKQHQEIQDARAEQCKMCPLHLNGTCNKSLFVATRNEEFLKNEIRHIEGFTECSIPTEHTLNSLKNNIGEQEYVSGCGCGLDAKRRVYNSSCPINLWKNIDRLYLTCDYKEDEKEEVERLGIVRFANKYKRQLIDGTTSI